MPLPSRRHSSAPAAMKPCRSDAKSSPSSERYEVGHTARPRNLERFKFRRRLSASSLEGSCPPLCHPHAIHGWTKAADGTKTAASARRPVGVDVDVDVDVDVHATCRAAGDSSIFGLRANSPTHRLGGDGDNPTADRTREMEAG